MEVLALRIAWHPVLRWSRSAGTAQVLARQDVMKKNAKLGAVIAIALLLLGAWMLVSRQASDVPPSSRGAVSSKTRESPTPLKTAPTAAPKALDPALKRTSPRTVRQRFARATNYKEFYDELALVHDETGEARYFMGRAVAACNLFTTFTLAQHEKSMPDLPQFATKRMAFREMARQCEGFYGYKGPTTASLTNEAAEKGYSAAVASMLRESDGAAANATAARLLEEGDPEAVQQLLYFAHQKARSWTLEVDGEPARADVAADAWRLYACSRGADCGPYLFERCWAKAECGAVNFQAYLRDYKPQTYSLITRFEGQIARAVEARDWNALGLVTSGPKP